MIYVFHLIDKPGALAQRQELRPLHKDYLGKVANQVAFAGPLTADDHTTMIGSLLAIDFPDRAAASACINQEPLLKRESMPV